MSLISKKLEEKQTTPHYYYTIYETIRYLSPSLKEHCPPRFKPQNILVSKENKVYICDMGISSNLNDETSLVTFLQKGTIYYQSPEIILENKISKPSDIYSLGIIIYELLFNTLPFKLTDLSLDNIKTFSKEIMIPPIETTDNNILYLYNLMKKCVFLDMNKRMTIEVIEKETQFYINNLISWTKNGISKHNIILQNDINDSNSKLSLLNYKINNINTTLKELQKEEESILKLKEKI